jgi:hypothetical protein
MPSQSGRVVFHPLCTLQPFNFHSIVCNRDVLGSTPPFFFFFYFSCPFAARGLSLMHFFVRSGFYGKRAALCVTGGRYDVMEL